MRCNFRSGKSRRSSGHFLHRLLHPVLAEDPFARGENRQDSLGAESLGDADERDRVRCAAAISGGAGDPLSDFGEPRDGSVCPALCPVLLHRALETLTPWAK